MIKSLEDLKKQKIKTALDKGYSENPEEFSFGFLCKRLHDEVFELEWELGELIDDGFKKGWNPPRLDEAKKECADISNIIDFIFKKIRIEYDRK